MPQTGSRPAANTAATAIEHRCDGHWIPPGCTLRPQMCRIGPRHDGFLAEKYKKMKSVWIIQKNIRTFAPRNCIEMYNLEALKIDLKGLQQDVTSFEYDLDDAYFSAIEATEVSGGNVHVTAEVRRCAAFFEVKIGFEGTVRVPCDRCLDEMEQPVRSEHRLIAKFGTEESEDDDVVVVDENEGMLDTAWLIYEYVALAIPVRHVHAPGKCNTAMMQALEELSTDRSRDVESDGEIDSRWSALLKLKENKS